MIIHYCDKCGKELKAHEIGVRNILVTASDERSSTLTIRIDVSHGGVLRDMCNDCLVTAISDHRIAWAEEEERRKKARQTKPA
jgi:hypothetical protein